MKKKKKILLFVAIIVLALSIVPFAISLYVVNSSTAFIRDFNADNLKSLEPECILVLGAGLKPDGTPSHMLQDRLEVGVALYQAGVASKLLLSGDHGQNQYDEVNAMKKYALDHNVPAEDIFLDHAGFSTYESMYRAQSIFEVKSAIVVTQKYHQYRALYLGQSFGMEVYGVCSDQRTYAGQDMRDVREVVARDKDFLKLIFKPEPTYMGNAIPISGNGLKSHD